MPPRACGDGPRWRKEGVFCPIAAQRKRPGRSADRPGL